MKVTHIKIRKADTPLTVMDSFVDRGLTEGGHASLPDIDVDYASDRRQEIKDYLEERYNVDGRQRVFSAGTFTTMKLKAALKDVARVHRVPHAIVNYITAMIDDGTDWTGLFMQATTNRKLREFIQTYPEVIEDVRGLLGQPKAASIHASAIIVTPDARDGRQAECFDYLPVRKMDGALVSEFDGYSVDEIGLLKEDVLATKELAKLSAVIALANSHFGQELSIERITQEMLDDIASIGTVVGQAHWHHNLTTLNSITESHVARWNDAYTTAMNLTERVGVNEGVFERFKTEILYDMQGAKTSITEINTRLAALEEALFGVEAALADIVEVSE